MKRVIASTTSSGKMQASIDDLNRFLSQCYNSEPRDKRFDSLQHYGSSYIISSAKDMATLKQLGYDWTAFLDSVSPYIDAVITCFDNASNTLYTRLNTSNRLAGLDIHVSDVKHVLKYDYSSDKCPVSIYWNGEDQAVNEVKLNNEFVADMEVSFTSGTKWKATIQPEKYPWWVESDSCESLDILRDTLCSPTEFGRGLSYDLIGDIVRLIGNSDVVKELRGEVREPAKISWRNIVSELSKDAEDGTDPLYEQTTAGSVVNDIVQRLEKSLNIYAEPSIQGGSGVVTFYTDDDDSVFLGESDYLTWNERLLDMALNSVSQKAFESSVRDFYHSNLNT